MDVETQQETGRPITGQDFSAALLKMKNRITELGLQDSTEENVEITFSFTPNEAGMVVTAMQNDWRRIDPLHYLFTMLAQEEVE